MSTKVIAVAVVLAVTLGGGWAAARRGIARGALAQDVRQDLADGHHALLQARLDLAGLNLDQTTRDLEAARTRLGLAEAHLERLGSSDDASQVRLLLRGIDDAERLVGRIHDERVSAAAREGVAEAHQPADERNAL